MKRVISLGFFVLFSLHFLAERYTAYLTLFLWPFSACIIFRNITS